MAGWNEWVPGANMTLSEVLDALKSASIGLDVKDKLYWSFFKIVQEAIKEGNANFDVEMAKGVYATLKDRLDAGDVLSDKALNEALMKIDDASGSVTMDNLDQAVKAAMTGGSVAVVGENAVGKINLTNDLRAIITDFEALMTTENESWAI